MVRFSVELERAARPPDRRPPEPAGEFSIDDEPDFPTQSLPTGHGVDRNAAGSAVESIAASDRTREAEPPSSARMPKKVAFAQLDERAQVRLRAAQEEFHTYWSSIPPERLGLVRRAAAARKQLEHIKWLLESEMEEELEELLQRLFSAVAAFGMQRVASRACRQQLPEILTRLVAESFADAEGDEFRLARLERVNLLRTVIERAIARANHEAEIDETRQRFAGQEFEIDDRLERLRIIYALSREQRELVRRRAEAPRNDASPWTDAERAQLARLRKDANERFAARRSVT